MEAQGTLKVSRMPSGEPEVFRSIQGEGLTAGTPSAFLRLATCNLACTWCDTRYTWDWERHDFRREVVAQPTEEIEERILGLGPRHLVITGGEPLLQQTELAPMVASLARQGVYCEVETNGTVAPLLEMAAAVSQWNVSPKTRSSGNVESRRESPAALRAFRELDNATFKFVVVEPEDIDDVSRLVDRYDIAPDRVLLMAEGVTATALLDRGAWVAEECARRGFRFTTRLHILLWGDGRGR